MRSDSRTRGTSATTSSRTGTCSRRTTIAPRARIVGRGDRARSPRVRHRPRAFDPLPAVGPPRVAEMALLLGMIAPSAGSSACPPTRSGCATWPSATSRTSGSSDTRCSRRWTSRSCAKLVPVGEDQVSHLEISREIVRRFNRLFGEMLVEPQPLLSDFPLVPGPTAGRCPSRSTTRSASTIPTRSGRRSGRSSPTRRRCASVTLAGRRSARSTHCTRFSPDIVDWTRDHCRSGGSAAWTARRTSPIA